MRLIDADALADALFETRKNYPKWVADMIGEMPTIDTDAMPKEQEEETTFVYDEYTLPTCKKCGFHPFAGYIPTIKWMKERGYMKCPRCGRTVKWN